MKKILFLLLVSLSAFGQRNGLIDADTTTRPKAGLSALAFSSGQLKIIRNTGNSYGVITSNNSYANPGWLASIALAKVTGLDTSIFLRKTTATSLYQPKGNYLTGITSGQVTTALGYTPYNATNPSGYITSTAISGKFNTADTSYLVQKTTATATYVVKEAGKGLSSNDYTTAEKSKLAGIATGATANSTDAQLRDRSTHTGTQAQSTVTGLVAALGAKSDTSHTHTTAKITDWTAAWAARFAAQSTSGLSEGSNLYYTDARVGTYGDARYGQLGGANSWGGLNTFSRTLTASSGNNSGLSVLPLVNQSGTAGYQAIWISPFEQSTGSGAKLPLDVGTNSAGNGGGTHTSRFSVASNGEINFGTLGRMFSNGNWFLGSSPVDAGYRLDINGTSRVSGNLVVTNIEAPTDGGGNVGVSGKAFSSVRAITFLTDNIRSRTGLGINFTTDTGVSWASQLPSGNFHFQNGGTYTDIPSARVAINSTSQGFLPPRMTQAQRNAIASPAVGLTLYCTDCTATDTSTGVMQTYNGSTWKNNW